jgi:cell division protein FtsX
VNDLDTRLERLAAEATRDAVPPDLEALARRGRRRRRRHLAGTALAVVVAVAAGLALPARLTGRPAPAANDPPATAADLTGASMLVGYWFGKTDASVYLEQGIDPARRRAVRERIEALDVVDRVYYESRQEAYDRFRHQYRAKPELVRRTDPAILPESFRVLLRDPDQFKRLYLALCEPGKPASGKPRCMVGVDTVLEDRARLKPVLVSGKWERTSDATVLLDHDITEARRRALQARLEAIGGVAEVRYESQADAFRGLAKKLREDRPLMPELTPAMLPTSFRVALDEPHRVREFHRALCGSRRTGDCPDGIAGVLEHPRR